MDREFSDLALLVQERIAETEEAVEQARMIIEESRQLLRGLQKRQLLRALQERYGSSHRPSFRSTPLEAAKISN